LVTIYGTYPMLWTAVPARDPSKPYTGLQADTTSLES